MKRYFLVFFVIYDDNGQKFGNTAIMVDNFFNQRMFDDYLKEQGLEFNKTIVTGMNEICKGDYEMWNTK